MELDTEARQITEAMGMDFFGVADLAPAHEAIMAQGGAAIAEFPRAISIGIALFHPIMDQLRREIDRVTALTFKHHCYDLINQRLDQTTSRLSSRLQREGFRVLPVPASQTVNRDGLCGIFSNKMAAHLAGLGWIGKSCLLVTPEVGPRVRWATVLTDAPLRVTGAPMAEQCGSCQECVEVCPPRAFTGKPFRESEPRDVRFAAHKCWDYLGKREEAMGVRVCGLCAHICPYGKGQQTGKNLPEGNQKQRSGV
jgi:epoxyqueuosine reductase QueG